eukprot:TRINITY_DN9246_c0_g1_i1.p1 TRINITY_DN9246_c0_g1~~TRINITY_DN9246_c0_g1_i1.p1  ORF type:complete len:120 (-),score=29.50 TRINITY_DN9246_c0_g1_i1:226-585(-)
MTATEKTLHKRGKKQKPLSSNAENQTSPSQSHTAENAQSAAQPADEKASHFSPIPLLLIAVAITLFPALVFFSLRDHLLQEYFNVQDENARVKISAFATMFALQISMVVSLVLALRKTA